MGLFQWMPSTTIQASTPSQFDLVMAIRQHTTMIQVCCLKHGSWWFRLSELMRFRPICPECKGTLAHPPKGAIFVWDERPEP